MEPVPYRGYVLRADPLEHNGGYTARVVIELHEANGDIHYQVVAGDPSVSYRSRDEAEEASIAFGKSVLDSRPPAPISSGERP